MNFACVVGGYQGLLFTEAAYLKSGWNLVDVLVLGAAWASFGAENQGINLSGGSLLKVEMLYSRTDRLFFCSSCHLA